jgi:hypothetical protein
VTIEDLRVVLVGEAPDGVHWFVRAGPDTDGGFYTSISRSHGDATAESGMGGDKFPPGQLINVWIGHPGSAFAGEADLGHLCGGEHRWSSSRRHRRRSHSVRRPTTASSEHRDPASHDDQAAIQRRLTALCLLVTTLSLLRLTAPHPPMLCSSARGRPGVRYERSVRDASERHFEGTHRVFPSRVLGQLLNWGGSCGWG